MYYYIIGTYVCLTRQPGNRGEGQRDLFGGMTKYVKVLTETRFFQAFPPIHTLEALARHALKMILE